MPPKFYAILSDLILAAHFAFVAFIILGFILIWLGYFLGWSFIYNFRFRLAHLLAMGFVVAESLIGMVCPLTLWENQLRLRAGQGATATYQESFMEHWLGGILYYELSERAFTILYLIFFVQVIITYAVVRPRRRVNKSCTR